MAALAFTLPILPGKEQADREMFEELKGSRREEYEAARRKLGFTREAVWHQETQDGGTVAVVYVEADDIGNAMEQAGSSDETFDRWFRERIQDIHGFDMAESDGAPPELIIDARF